MDRKIVMTKIQAIIVTLFDDYNIGNRLQNYALQQVLLNQGAEVTILDNGYTSVPRIKGVIKIHIKGFLGILGNKKYKKHYQKYISIKKIRKASYKFDENNLKNVVKVSNKGVFEKDWSEYDIAFAGSDQVWHKWRNDKYELPFYYLEFLPEKKRAAYAASFGFEEFPVKDKKQHEVGIKGMRYISCRETRGCELVSSVIGRDVEHVLDPTLLLDVSEWRKIESQASNRVDKNKRYAVVFFLGERTEEYKKFIKTTVSKRNMELVIDPLSDGCIGFKEFGPCEFLRLIDNADYVFTDSFHCTVFSVWFDKPFTAFRRKQTGMEKMFGRIEDLLASKGMLDHIYGGTSVKATNDFEELKSRSLKYIDNVLEGIDNGKNRKN